MGHVIVTTLYTLSAIVGVVMSFHGLYFVVVALVGFKQAPKIPHANPETRFAVAIAARNEEMVIGQLLDSLRGQNYPAALYDIFVAPNNCIDNTHGIAEKCGATIIELQGRITSKGQVLTQVCDFILAAGTYDAVCIIDADNLVHPDFLQKMNDAFCQGTKIAQGFRDSKNPSDTAVSTCFSICYWMLDKFYNAGRELLGLSSLVNGTGFMVSTDVLKQIGGFHTQTITEDYELTAQFVLHGHSVHYVRGAVVYDEEPLTFAESWSERRRWGTGCIQNIPIYLAKLIRIGVKKRSWACLDVAITYMTPILHLISVILGLANGVWGCYRLFTAAVLTTQQILFFSMTAVLLIYLACTLLAAFVVWQNERSLQGMLPGILFYMFFLLSWIPITILCFFKKTTNWTVIPHTKAIAYDDLVKEKTLAEH